MIVALLNQQGGVGKTTLALHLGGVWACQGQRVAVIDADPDACCAVEWSELRAQETLPSRFTVIAIARDTLHRELPTITRDVDRAIIDGPSHIEPITRSALMAAEFRARAGSSAALPAPGIRRNAAARERDDDRSTAPAHPTRSQPLQRARQHYARPDPSGC